MYYFVTVAFVMEQFDDFKVVLYPVHCILYKPTVRLVWGRYSAPGLGTGWYRRAPRQSALSAGGHCFTLNIVSDNRYSLPSAAKENLSDLLANITELIDGFSRTFQFFLIKMVVDSQCSWTLG